MTATEGRRTLAVRATAYTSLARSRPCGRSRTVIRRSAAATASLGRMAMPMQIEHKRILFSAKEISACAYGWRAALARAAGCNYYGPVAGLAPLREAAAGYWGRSSAKSSRLRAASNWVSMM